MTHQLDNGNGRYPSGNQRFWAKRKKKLAKCDNQAVANLRKSNTKDAFLAACARNIWLMTALYDLEINYVHITGKENVVADDYPGGILHQVAFLSCINMYLILWVKCFQ